MRAGLANTAARRISAGVTLIELIVGITILGIAMAAMLPEVGAWLRNLAVRNAGESMRAGVERARLEALRRNAPVTFWLVSDSAKVLSNGCSLSTSGPSWVISVSDPGGKCGAEPSMTDDPLLVDKWSAADGANGVQIQGFDAGGGAVSSVTFNSLGQVQGAGAQLERVEVSHSTAGTRNLRVLVQTGGSVRMCDPNVAADDPRRC